MNSVSTKIWKFFPCRIGTRHAMQTLLCLLNIWPCFVHSQCASPVTDLEPDHPIKPKCVTPVSRKPPTDASSEMGWVILLSPPHASKPPQVWMGFFPKMDLLPSR